MGTAPHLPGGPHLVKRDTSTVACNSSARYRKLKQRGGAPIPVALKKATPAR
jgi:hypothetical protein